MVSFFVCGNFWLSMHLFMSWFTWFCLWESGHISVSELKNATGENGIMRSGGPENTQTGEFIIMWTDKQVNTERHCATNTLHVPQTHSAHKRATIWLVYGAEFQYRADHVVEVDGVQKAITAVQQRRTYGRARRRNCSVLWPRVGGVTVLCLPALSPHQPARVAGARKPPQAVGRPHMLPTS